MHVVYLTPSQSVCIHGWLNPKRTLCWNDVCKSPWIDVKLLARAGISQDDMAGVQPDILEWISEKGVSFDDVPLMTRFPLHPIRHLGGDISSLVEHRYSSRTLSDIGFTFGSLTIELGMRPQWMKMLSFTTTEWIRMGMTRADVDCMAPDDVRLVFGVHKERLAMAFANA